ncbi:MAG: hypothetical protein LAP21_04805 [Acidobacteriia bacterium]|nr:hypothetical protein [Terriglobia bacterium]
MNPVVKPRTQTGIALMSFLLLCTAFSMAGTQKPAVRSDSAPRAAVRTAVPQAAATSKNDELAGLKMDLARMQSLVQQMDVNIAQVDTLASPLKHQFQLEIDAWRVMITNMQRRIEAMERK